mgnify:FL=1
MAEYVPQLFQNPIANAALVTVLPATLYTAAAYGQLYLAEVGLAFKIIMSCFFAILEYVVRVPINEYSANVAGLSTGNMQLLWIVLTMGLAFIIPSPKK